MINYKNNTIVQTGGSIRLFFLILLIFILLICSCASSSWPYDLDKFAGGTFKDLKFNNPFSAITGKIYTFFDETLNKLLKG